MTGRKFSVVIFSQLVLLLGFLTIGGQKAAAKELTNVISDIHVWKTNYREVTPDANGVYPLSDKDSYSLQVAFDLSEAAPYVQDGDYFNFAVPAPLTVADGTIALVDDGTGLTIGEGTVSSNGEGQGGSVRITLTNLAAYLEQKSAQEVENIRGTFYVSFTVAATETEVPVTFNQVKTVGSLSFTIKVDQWQGWSDNTLGLAGENFAKYDGVVSRQTYTSASLGQSGDWVHPWSVRINASRKNYSSLTVTDTIESGKGTQFIPESLVLQATETGFDSAYQIQNPVTLTEGQDYTVTYSDDHTKLVVTILNPGNRAFHLGYSTTTPRDGSLVTNVLRVASPEGDITTGDHTQETSVQVSRSSLVTQGGTIQLEVGSRITIEKVDEATGERLSGAVFKVTKPDGTEITLAPTDANGLTQSPRFTEAELASGQFIVTEVTAPEGYQLDATPLSLQVTQAGVVQRITNSKIGAAAVTITANKILTGRTLQEGEFTFVLTSADGQESYTAKNKADGTISFEELTFTEAGTYTYTLKEEEGSDLTVVYDTDPKTVTVTVTDNGSGQLTAEVTSGPVTFTNKTVPSIVTPPSTPDSSSSSSSTSGSSSDSTSPSASTSESEDSIVNPPTIPGSSEGQGPGTGAGSHTVGTVNVKTDAGSGQTTRVLPRTGDRSSAAAIISLALLGLSGLFAIAAKKARG